MKLDRVLLSIAEAGGNSRLNNREWIETTLNRPLAETFNSNSRLNNREWIETVVNQRIGPRPHKVTPGLITGSGLKLLFGLEKTNLMSVTPGLITGSGLKQ
ncbi:protein of unknown function [Methylocaldum szegediense]|uniref:Uncharacterized protein n=1 Tax=Methylocaldum szegediense TaxID=73780 RepID=A0ABN8XEL6_9GAMM|nr:protein of unknown function [Methylocaldum szegediense]